jgi:hypothetical protein
LIISCTKEEDTLPPTTSIVAPSKKTAILTTKPLIAKAPSTGEKNLSSTQRYFPNSNKANAHARTTAVNATDYVDFDDEIALTILPDQAAYTFASAPFYIQPVGNAWIHVKENNDTNYYPDFRSDYRHYHLSYQNFVPCLGSDGKFGKPSGSSCLPFNPVLEPRTLDTHDGNQWIKIYAYDRTNPSRVFDLLDINITNGPIQLWFRQASGGWFYWPSLGTGLWDTSAYTQGITEVLISGTGYQSIGIGALQVRVPDY